MAQNNNLYTRIKRHIAQKIAYDKQQKQQAARQRYYTELAVWEKVLRGDKETAKKFYAEIGAIKDGLDVFYFSQCIKHLTGDDGRIAYAPDSIVVVVEYWAIYRAYGIRDCAHGATVYNLNAQKLYSTTRDHEISFIDVATNIKYWYDRFRCGIITNKGSFESNHPYIIDYYYN